jgi:hypothetical protein
MCEPSTHRGWAERTLARADAFGVADPWHTRVDTAARMSIGEIA